MRTWKSAWIVVIVLAAFTMSCSKYERQVVPFQLPSALPNATEVSGATIAAKAFSNKKDAEAAFGFDILDSGVYPIQVVFDNRGTHPLEVVPNQTFLTDVDNKTWPILDQGLAYQRISEKTEYGKVAPEAAKAGLLGGAAGAILGAAIGIVSGMPVGQYAARGAAAGAAVGATFGGAKGLNDPDVNRQIREDLQQRSLENRAIKPTELAYGFIFFPGEAKKGKDLRMLVKETDTGKTYVVNFPL